MPCNETIRRPHCCNMKASCKGISRSQEKTTGISYVVGKLSFTDTPQTYNKGSNVEGKVSAFGLHFFNVLLYTVQLKPWAFSVIQRCSSDRLKRFITIIQPFLTCRCSCLRVKGGHRVGYRISQPTVMVSPLSH